MYDDDSCLMYGRFDFTLDTDNAKWGSAQEIYRMNGVATRHGAHVIKGKNRIRGSGNALMLRFEPSAFTGTHILGYAVNVEEVVEAR